MTRSASDRIDDISTSARRCQVYRAYLTSPDAVIAEMAYDAILRNLAVIGEAARALPSAITEAIPEVPWASISGLRNVVVHEYFRVDTESVVDIVDNHITTLVQRLRS